MKSRMLISADDLYKIRGSGLQGSGSCLIVDCRFSLGDPQEGREAYLKGHIPGAVYANLDKDLSSPVTNTSGRHPLPGAMQFSEFLARIGWYPGSVVVAYDDMGGAFAARLWWLMKYFGHNEVKLLDGGFPSWLASGYATSGGGNDMNVSTASPMPLSNCEKMVVSASEVEDGLASDSIVLLDARASERFSGDLEPLDTVAGHIPGAQNLPFGLNLDQDKHFKPVEDIRNQWQAFQGKSKAKKANAGHLVHMCGSGVTACFNLFAAELAGIEGSRIYAGSWSEWIRDSSRGIEKG